MVAFGLESGVQSILDGVGKGTTLDQAREAVSMARSHNITTLGYFMVGLPGETLETLETTLRFAKELPLDYAKFSITVPLPGTDLYRRWDSHINTNHFRELNIHHPNKNLFKHPSLSWAAIESFLERAYREFYFRPQYISQKIWHDLRNGGLLFNLETALRIHW
jgi:radical SAM superfamily enzyme YgiQ (UPF0313 family)